VSSLRPVTLITGASTGIGRELAHVFAANGHELALTARNEALLTQLADAIGAAGNARPHVLPMDLSRLDGCARLAHELVARGLAPTHVVNNAGFGLVGAADELDRAEQVDMVDLNVRALTDLSLRWLDVLREHRGGLLNVASVAGFLPGPGMAVYYATKAFVLSFTEALHHELAGNGVRVTVLCPGPVATEFQARSGMRDSRQARLLQVPAEKVARAGYDGLLAGKRLVIPGFLNKVVTLAPRFVPRGVILKLTDTRHRRRWDRGPQWRRPT
jgi:short-subunit dehydrogenase